ncbi:precorrin-2 C(20)-methyltransferase [Rubrimonas cliftonensis]|uniref:Precorrin-2 C20-methyltransferase n=1 Tax=Rubrimonas cliftonensis TaxID=89524 RepID=A0A1H4FWG0_9RHOB|nr:precorrin-2 C(20)-methyltransferase [Rubrimonas cliftonensis]SEB01666.1 precorrin-2 C20-methyltransferase [Rubrimonas cliftonensis]
MNGPAAQGRVYGVGVGPGDPELMTVRADRLVRSARHVAYFRKAGRPGQARRIVEGMLCSDAVEHAMEYPVTTEIPLDDPAYAAALAPFYAECAARLLALVGEGEDVVTLCEGDPFFYGSFMHLHARIRGHAAVEIVPGVTGMSAAWTATDEPVTWGDDVLTVLTGTLPEPTLVARMQGADALVVMKVGRNLPKVRRAIAAAGMLERAWLVENAAMPGQTVAPLAAAAERAAPYFSIVIVHGRGRRP